MGLFNKLKNALFEEEEIEIPIKETPENKPVNVIREDSVVKKVETEKTEEVNERDLFKAENTFKFPEFDEEEFVTSYKPPIEKVEKREPVITPKESFDRVKPITYEFDKKTKQNHKEITKREMAKEEIAPVKKTFKPSPVISPVYGVLDKNYKKEDIITVKEEKPKKKFDVDAIRKKAFGTLEDDIEQSFESPKEDFYNRTSKNIDDLLNDTADDAIDIKYEKRSETRERRNAKGSYEEESINNSRSERRNEELIEEESKHYTNAIEDEFENENLQVLDENNKSEEQKFEEDTLENDLFDLIDSMYDNREEEEE